MDETVKVELDVPLSVYRALEYICSIGPVYDIRDYMLWCFRSDVQSMSDSGWDQHIYFINKKLKEMLGEAEES